MTKTNVCMYVCMRKHWLVERLCLLFCLDDGSMIFYDLVRFDRVRRIDLVQWAADRQLPQLLRANVPRKLKCVHLYEDYNHHYDSSGETGGSGGSSSGGLIVVGTSFGDVFVCTLGATI